MIWHNSLPPLLPPKTAAPVVGAKPGGWAGVLKSHGELKQPEHPTGCIARTARESGTTGTQAEEDAPPTTLSCQGGRRVASHAAGLSRLTCHLSSNVGSQVLHYELGKGRHGFLVTPLGEGVPKSPPAPMSQGLLGPSPVTAVNKKMAGSAHLMRLSRRD